MSYQHSDGVKANRQYLKQWFRIKIGKDSIEVLDFKDHLANLHFVAQACWLWLYKYPDNYIW